MSTAIQNLRPRERRGDRTRARLVEAALEEFRANGFERASIARIAKNAGVSRPSFYFHFSTKQDLLREVLLGIQGRLAERVESTGREGALRDALAELVAGILEFRDEIGPDVFAEMLRAQTRSLPEKPEDEPQPVMDVLDRRFLEAAERGELRTGLDAQYAPRLYLASLFGCLLDAEGAATPEGLGILTGLFLNDSPSAHSETNP